MPLFYKSRQSTFESKDKKKKWFPRLVKVGKMVETEVLAQQIAFSSSLTPGDVQNVLANLTEVMRQHLMNSRSVRLAGLGSFTVIAKAGGNGVDTAEEVNPNQINTLRIQFTPSYTRNTIEGTTRAMFSGISFEKWPDAATGSKDPDDGGGTEPLG